MMLKILIVILIVSIGHLECNELNKRQTTCACGTVNRRTRIIGGTETEVNEYPWMCALRQLVPTQTTVRVLNVCGATLINNQYLITAAHCFNQISDVSGLRIYLGDHVLDNTTETNGVVKGVRRYIIHPDYNNATIANDIAIIELDSLVNYQSNIQPLCLPPPNLNLNGQSLTVTGWGSVEQAGRDSTVLREASIPVVNNSACQLLYRDTSQSIRTTNICAATSDGSKDACQGDSGGPAAYQCDTTYYLGGVVSYGIDCGNPSFPGIYTNVTMYRDWIYTVIPAPSECYPTCYPGKQSVDDCGIANDIPPLSKRLVGGTETSRNKYKWMVSIYVYKNGAWTFNCSGSIISRSWIITTASCVSGVPPNNMFIVVGDYNIADDSEPGEAVVFPSQVVIHPSYNIPYLANDIALIQLESDLTFNNYVGRICIPSNTSISPTFANVFVKLLGWGRTSTNGPYATRLREVLLYTLTNDQCKVFYGTTIIPGMFCTASSSSADACEGDTGGILMLQGDSRRYYAVGLQSFRYRDACGSGNPSGNTRVSSYTSWIQQVSGVAPAATSDIL